MAAETVIINGYAWRDVRVVFLGRSIEGITDISWQAKQVKENRYGTGDEPKGRGRGNKEYSGSMTLYMEEVEAIELSLEPGQDLMDIAPSTMVISYINDSLVSVHHTIPFVEFLNNGREPKQGDTKIMVKLDLIMGKPKTN
jgi:hypothetical protein